MRPPTSPTPSTSGSLLGSFASRSVSPLPPPANYRRASCLSATSKSYKYLRRLLKFNQMDFEFALWQMFYLFVNPQMVYRNFNYRKQTKAQFARDDPAFLVLLVVCLCVTSLGFAYVLELSFWQSISLIFYVVFVDCIFAGIIVATCFWVFMNRYLKRMNFDSDIEWGYAFDVHLNAFFPPLILLHFIQILIYNVALHQPYFLSILAGNSFWLIALMYYVYITFLGYNCILPLVERARPILVFAPILIIVYFITLILKWNVSVTFMNFYKFRVY